MNKDNKLPPINSKPCLWWKKYGKHIVMQPKSKKDKDKIQLLNKIINKAQECMRHKLEYVIFSKYRLYRRGKNRCKNCGVKI